MLWVDLVPGELERLARDEGLCVVPMGCLERHGEHLPFGCDLVIAETIASRAAEQEPCVVFPGYFLGQAHEAACFTGTVNVPQDMAVKLLACVLQGIARNGFRKIAILNCHGGNNAFLDYFSMSQIDEERPYVLYFVDPFDALSLEGKSELAGVWNTRVFGHADEQETSVYMACKPGRVRLDLAETGEVLPLDRFAHLSSAGVHNAHWWYAQYPGNVTGTPSAATEQKGRKALDLLVAASVRALRVIKADEAAPALQREFLRKMCDKGGQGERR